MKIELPEGSDENNIVKKAELNLKTDMNYTKSLLYEKCLKEEKVFPMPEQKGKESGCYNIDKISHISGKNASIRK